MTDLLRQEIAATATTIVVKVGTRVLTHENGTLNEQRITQLAEELNSINETGRRVVLVSSGAVGAGMSQLGLKARPTGLARLQAVAAIGQTNLIEMYDRTFRLHGRRAAQVLLTAEDLEDRSRYLNVRNTLMTLLEFNAIPIINENDTVSVEELMTTFGDNDRLAALVTNLLRAPLLIILSDVAGLYDGDPGDPESSLIQTVPVVDETILAKVRDRVSGASKGGMFSKLQSAKIVSSAGETLIIASGKQPSVLRDIMAGKPVGTLFLPQGKSTQPRGRILLDPGACKAISHDGGSLLAIGITAAKGEFAKGDVVSLCGSGGTEFARGLTNYESCDIERIKGLKSDRIAEILGHCPYEEVVHRDNLAVL